MLADEVLVCTMNLLRENVLERAAGRRNQSSEVGQLGKEDIVDCCEESVEVGAIVAPREVRSSPQIIPTTAYPPVLDKTCQ